MAQDRRTCLYIYLPRNIYIYSRIKTAEVNYSDLLRLRLIWRISPLLSLDLH